MSELRGSRGTTVAVQPIVGQAPPPIPEESFTIPVNVAVVGPTALYTPAADRRWVATAIVLVATAPVTVQLLSGLTNRAGPMALAANQALVVVGDAARNVLRSAAVGDALNITLGGAVQVGGWIQLREVGQR